jgi:hypothetical protein
MFILTMSINKFDPEFGRTVIPKTYRYDPILFVSLKKLQRLDTCHIILLHCLFVSILSFILLFCLNKIQYTLNKRVLSCRTTCFQWRFL